MLFRSAEEGNLDSSHVGFLHRTMDPSVGMMAPSQRNRGALLLDSGAPQLTVAETEFGFVYGARRDAPDGNFFWRVTPFQVPCFSTVPGNTWPRLAHAIVPIDDENSIWFEIQYNPFEPLPVGMRGTSVRIIAGTHVTYGSLENDYTIDRELQKTGNYTGILRGREQDLAVVDSMTPILNRTVEHLGTADAAIIAYRRLLMRLARALQQGEEPWMASHPEAYRVRPLDVVVPEANLNGLIASHRSQVMVGF